LIAQRDPRFSFAAQRIGTNYGVDILAPERPYRMAWLSRGLQPDGWTTPGRVATIRAFAASNTALGLTIGLAAPASAPAVYELRAAGSTVRGTVSPGSSKTEELRVCAGPGGSADIRLASTSSTRVPGIQRTLAAVPDRRVGVSVAAVSVRPTLGVCG
jgi:hypothetical protein